MGRVMAEAKEVDWVVERLQEKAFQDIVDKVHDGIINHIYRHAQELRIPQDLIPFVAEHATEKVLKFFRAEMPGIIERINAEN
jgi:hypothetical protein